MKIGETQNWYCLFFVISQSLASMKSEKKGRSKNAKQPRDSTPVPSARARTHPQAYTRQVRKQRERERERDGWMKTEREGKIDECQIRFHLLHSCSLRHRAIGFFITHQNPDLILASYFAFYRPNQPTFQITNPGLN
jgi:hypothetical protein